MPQIENSIQIHATKAHVLDVARDNERFPEFMADVDSVRVLERSDDGSRIVSAWVGIVPKFGVKVRWTEEDIWDFAAGTCTFRQLTGDYDEFEGIWRFTESGEGNKSTIFHSNLNYRLEIPLVGGLIQTIIQKTMQNNLMATLEAIKRRSELGTDH